LRIWPVAFGGLAVDLWSKHWAFTHGNVPDESRVVVDKLLSFQLSLNSGALFGLGRGMAPLFVAASVLALLFVWYLFTQSTRDRRSLHVALGLILGGALGNLYDRSFHEADAVFGPPAPGFWHGLLGDHVYATGVLLNAPEDPIWQLGRFPDGIGDVREVPNREELYLKSVPVVRDFIKIDATILGKPVWQWIFNIADVLLVIGVGLLLLNFWWERRAYNASTEATADSRHNP
jgi:signal peptidase II